MKHLRVLWLLCGSSLSHLVLLSPILLCRSGFSVSLPSLFFLFLAVSCLLAPWLQPSPHAHLYADVYAGASCAYAYVHTCITVDAHQGKRGRGAQKAGVGGRWMALPVALYEHTRKASSGT